MLFPHTPAHAHRLSQLLGAFLDMLAQWFSSGCAHLRMFQDSLIIMTFFIMFGSFIKCNALPVHLLRQVYKNAFFFSFLVSVFFIVFYRFFIDFWSILGPPIGYFSMKKWAVFLTIFWYAFSSILSWFLHLQDIENLQFILVFQWFLKVFTCWPCSTGSTKKR